MSAPGNSVLLGVLLAVFVACTAYAAGRLHQWYRTDVDRDEAYRDGYDTATRSVFSLAARIIAPRREKAAIRASASVIAATAKGTPASSAAPAAAPVAEGADRRRKLQRNAAPATAIAGPSAPVTPPASVGPSAPGGAPAAVGLPAPLTADQLAMPPLIIPGFQAGVAAATATDGAEAMAVVGPLPSGSMSSGPLPSGPVAGGERFPADPKFVADGEDPVPGESAPAGRHLVPDELVQATTYRLAPDRVARAKVRDVARVANGEVTTARLVPKPRSS